MKYVVVMKDPITGEEKNLTMPAAKQPAENYTLGQKSFLGLKTSIWIKHQKHSDYDGGH